MYKLIIYKWLIDLLKEHPKGMTFRQIKNDWDLAPPSIKDPFLLQKRTFHRYRSEIFELFDIDIVCKKVYDRYVYKIDGPLNIDKYELMLGGCVDYLQFLDDPVDVKILASGGAIDWMERLLVDADYKESDPTDGVVTFEFESAIDEELPRLLLPYADSIVIKEPDILAVKVRDLLYASIDHMNKQP